MMTNHTKSDKDVTQISLDLAVPVVVEQLPHLPPAIKGTAASSHIRYKDFGELTFADYEIFKQLPPHPFWSQVEQLVDFSFADELCAHLYSPNGQRPYAPSLKLKVHLIQAMENLSDREMEVRMMFDIAIKRFLGVPMSFTGFDHSTIGLNRERMGDHLFHACFHYVLAQAKTRQLWGSGDDRWLVDSFHTHARAVRMGAYRLVYHAMLNLVQQLKRANRPLFERAASQLKLAEWMERAPGQALPEERAVAFSLLVSRAYALLSWFEHGEGKEQFWKWADKKQQLRSIELQAILFKVLQQNTRPTPPSDPTRQTDAAGDSDRVEFEKIPRKERPKDRIVNAYNPDLRNGHKTVKQPFTGDKIQLVESDASRFILEIEPIPGNEPDGERLSELAESVMRHHETSPTQVVADSAYGHGRHRQEIQEAGLTVVAPLKQYKNPTGLLGSEHFSYDAKSQQVKCPEGNTTTKRVRNNVEEGYQFKFAPEACALCSRRAECTTNDKGRTIFVSDYYELYLEAKTFNESDEGQSALRARSKIERTNNELANHHEMRRPHAQGRDKLRTAAKLKAMAVNIKIMVKKLGTLKEDPFVRRQRRTG